jgi:hypothetical protein
MESIDMKIMVKAGTGIKERPYSKNNQSKKGWW